MKNNMYAVLIGSNTYSDKSLSKLRYAEKDCEDLEKVLTDKKTGLFLNKNVFTLLGIEATTNNVETALHTHVVSDRSPEDMVLVYISGHGFIMPDLKKTYLATYDVSKKRLSNNPREGLDMDFLHDKIFKRSKARNVIFVMDTCHSGAFVPTSRGSKPKLLIDEHFYSTGSGRTAIMSCTHDEQSHERDDLKNGVFTHYLIKGLNGKAAESGTNEITIDSLLAYVRRHIPHEQKPVRYGHDCGRVVLARSLNNKEELHTYSLYSHSQLIDGAKLPKFLPLPNPIEVYKPFIDKLTGLLADEHQVASYDPEKRILEAIRLSSKAEFVFLTSVDKDKLNIKFTSNLSMKGISKSKYINDIICNYLARVISKGDIFKSDYKGLFTTYSKSNKTHKIHIAIPISITPPCKFMVICGLAKNSYFLGEPYVEILSALYSASQSLHSVNALTIESAILDRLKHSHGFMPASIYNHRFEIFKKRLNQMDVHFQGILKLERRSPHIDSYEALARDPHSNKAPFDLFDAAQLWGQEFMVELDSYFLNRSINNYCKALAENGREYTPDLSVNVYPSSLVKESYRDVLTDVVNKELIPPNNLILEISEKLPLPSQIIDGDGVRSGVCSFREMLVKFASDLGIGFCIDDFGVGHASLANLLKLNPRFVKIDREILKHESVYDALEFTLSLIKALTCRKYLASSKVVIEGYDSEISEKVKLDRLFALGVRYIQGYFYANIGPSLCRLEKDMKLHIKSLIEGKSATLRKDNAKKPKANQRRFWPR